MSILTILIEAALDDRSEIGLFDLIAELDDGEGDDDAGQVIGALERLGWLRDGTLRHEHQGIAGIQPRYVRRHVA